MLRLGRRFVTRNMDDVFDLGHSALQNTQSLANNAPVGVRALHSTIRRRNALFRSIMKERVVLVGGVQNGGVMKASSQQIRNFSEANAGEEKKAPTSLAQYDYDDYDDYEEPTTAGGKVAMWTRMMLQLALLGAFAGCTYITFQELFPGRMSPNRIYSDAFEFLKSNAEVQRMIGENMTAFGRSAGRRHFDSRSYTDDYGGNRCRIRFNIRGSRGQIMVWAEMADTFAESSEEFAYLICQDRRTGRVLTVQDNRSRLDEMAASGKLVINESLSSRATKMITGLIGGAPPEPAK
jgi:hypothetical protein